MIPKIIHYCWFGGKEYSALAKKCINNWKKMCPDYKFIEWNEKNFNVNCNNYVKEAYSSKKWAFVSDVARMYALLNYGGIYLDTDVEIIKNFDSFLENDSFFGFESNEKISTAVIGCCKNNKIIKEVLDYYDDAHFKIGENKYDLTPNVVLITEVLKKYGLKTNGENQIVENYKIYSADYFSPIDYETKKMNKTLNTYTIHWFNASWIDNKSKIKSKFFKIVKIIIGKKNYNKIKNKIKK